MDWWASSRGGPPTDILAAGVGVVQDLELTEYRTADDISKSRIAKKVVLHYADKVRQLANRMCNGAEKDAMQAGAIGLLAALNKFDPSRKVPFWFFAKQYVSHEINKFLNHGYVCVRWEHSPERRRAEETRFGAGYRSFDYMGENDVTDPGELEGEIRDRDLRYKLGGFLATLDPRDC